MAAMAESPTVQRVIERYLADPDQAPADDPHATAPTRQSVRIP